MSTEKNTFAGYTGRECETIEAFHATIQNFYDYANPSEFAQTNEQLLNTFIKTVLNPNNDYPPEYIETVVRLATFQNTFIAQLKEHWENYQSLATPQTEAA